MQFFSLDGSDLQSNVLLVFHMCESVSMSIRLLCECVFAMCVSVCPKEQACVRLYSLITPFSQTDSLS